MSTQSKIEQRKAVVLDAAHTLDRDIWVGDVAITPLEQESFRPAFNALVSDGILSKQRLPGTAKVYYSLVAPNPSRATARPLYPEGELERVR